MLIAGNVPYLLTETQKTHHARTHTNRCKSSERDRFTSFISYLIQVIIMTEPVKFDHLTRGTLEYNNMEQAYHQHYYVHHQQVLTTKEA